MGKYDYCMKVLKDRLLEDDKIIHFGMKDLMVLKGKRVRSRRNKMLRVFGMCDPV